MTQNGRVHTQVLGQTTTVAAPRGGRAVLALIWDFWKAYAEKIAFYQTLVILTVIYGIVVGPIWAIGRLTGHQFLPQLPKGAPTLWHAAHMGRIGSLDELRKQG